MVLAATITGAPALIIILIVLLLLVVGFLVVVKGIGRGVSKAARAADRHKDRP